jgi:glycine cleavage system H protein
MFPWSPEFRWDAYHLAFFSAFYAVVATITCVLALSAGRARRDARAGRGPAVAWRLGFEELPARDRACRHQLTGLVPGRTCDNGFDCRTCATHASLRSRDAGSPSWEGDSDVFGLRLPLDRLYHRGHTFVRPEPDGTVTVGLDDLALRLVGAPERVELPAAGTRLSVNGPALRLESRGNDVRVLSPVDGVVVGVAGEGAGSRLRVDPAGPLVTTHLLCGPEVRPWALRELERLHASLAASGPGVALADGGELVPDIGASVPRAQLEGLLGAMFLDP